MAKMEVNGLDEYALLLSRFEANSEGFTKASIYEGASVVADAIAREIEALPIDNGRGTEKKKIKGITVKQKSDLLKGAGLADMKKENGDWNTKYGFDGYGSQPTKKYPKGLPNVLLVRSIIAGTSFRQKNSFVRRAVNRVIDGAIQAMANKIDELMEKEFK